MSPTFNHSRADGPFDPCDECLGRMTRAQILALVRDMRACAASRDWFFEFSNGQSTCGIDLSKVVAYRRMSPIRGTTAWPLFVDVADCGREYEIPADQAIYFLDALAKWWEGRP